MKAHPKGFTIQIILNASTVLCLLGVAFGSGCATSPKGLPLTSQPCNHTRDFGEGRVHIQYLGTGGYLFRFGTNALLTPPFYSNFSLLRVGFTPLSSKRKKIEQHLPDLTGVSAVLVGHSHYDHLLDLPHVLRFASDSPVVFGNSSNMIRLLAGTVTNDLVNVEEISGSYERNGRQGKWLTNRNGSIRFMALASMHAPHLGRVKLFSGDVEHRGEPHSAWGWKDGHTFAYIIDFLDKQGPVLRVLYQDSAVDGTRYGFLPDFDDPADHRRPDLAILCLASFRNVEGYPKAYLDNVQPDKILIGHWEDFFRSRSKPPKVVRGTDAKHFIRELPAEFHGKRMMMPTPDTCFVLRTGPRA
jgi:hypothetical protein